ncbi:MAG TPA: cellulase family glycosylhydrolase [Verrucomicrobiae bacterium]|nr:cellulase family glycosylhydrolase [Verrucomicrobiae bacterium]
MRSPLKIRWSAVLFTLLCTAAPWLSAAESPFQNFITARDGKLFDGPDEFRFISWNIPNLLIIEDNFAWNAPNDWLLPDEFELTDAFASVRQLGGTVVRSYSLPVQRADEDAGIPKYVRALGKYNEDGFRTLDLALKLANEQKIRLIIPLVNNWPWQGGREEFAAWRHRPKDDFWTDPQIIDDFEKTVRNVLTRTNSLTGVRYLDDKSILCWETGNELRGPASWTKTIATFIKRIDPNHLVMDGYDSGIRPEVLMMPAVDIVTTHHYPSSGDAKSMADQIRDDARLVNGKKVYLIGEFGFAKTDEMSEAMQAIRESTAAGGLLWSLRFRNRTGGFYWHSEPDGANLYKAFHWPPSSVGDPYDEIRLIDLVRTNAFAIRNLPVPEIPVPAAPKLLPITDPAAISWQGSVGATGYQVERAAGTHGDWLVIATNIDEALAQYRPQYADETVTAGTWFYRVRAKNGAGTSEPSNPSGPVVVTNATLVDELADFSRIQSQAGGWKIASTGCRVTKEDIHRAAGIAGDTLVYKLPAMVNSIRVFSYFPETPRAIKFSISDDGEHFHPLDAEAENGFHGAGDYGYWKPVLFHAEKITGGKFLKLELTRETQIGRVEISYPAPSQ